jgi:flagellar hook-associated protein 3 FlgL
MDLSLLESLQRSNTGAMARLAQSQDALADMRTTASEMLEALVALPTGDAAARTLVIQAQTSLARLADRLNASDGGSYLFGGINTDEAPFSRFDDGPAAAIAAAFNGRFLFSPGDPAAAGITPAQIVDFIENEFADLFADPDWGTTWSTASSTNIVSRIAPGERIETSANANETAFRTLARGLSMLAGIGFESLNSTTRDAVVEQAQLVIGAAVTEIAAVQGRLGFAENSIEKANTRLSHAADVLRMTITEKEGTDPAAAKVRVDLLTTQIEMSYALTNQLSRLSILNYA